MKNYALLIACLLCGLNMLASIDLSRTQELREFKAFNGIKFQYSLLVPANFNKDKTYEIVAVLTEVHVNDHAWAKALVKLKAIDLKRTILIVPKVPVGHESWGTHPIHHAFNDLLKSVRKSYGVANQKIHLIGLEAGQETAFWWTFGSKNLIASTSIINGHLWKEKRWDTKWYHNLIGSGVPIFAYEDKEIDKFDMSEIKFQDMTSIADVIQDIESRSW